MNDTTTKLPTVARADTVAAVGVPTTKGELVAPPSPPTLDQLAVLIRHTHSEVVAATVDAVVAALETGKTLRVAKKLVGHGNFADYVAVECRFSMSKAQNYMRLARREDEVRQMVAAKAQGGGYLTLGQALKFIGALSHKKRPRA
jgi:hypothetical protein